MNDMNSGDTTEHYRGAQLVSDESFLRRLPMAVALESRIRFDAIVIACDIISQAYQDLSQLAGSIGSDVTSLSNSKRAAMIGLCWNIIDQVHAVRQLVRPPPERTAGSATQRFLDVSDTATVLRNKMDHLNANLRNLAEKRGGRFPLFGALSYVFSNDDPATGGHLLTIASGALQGSDVFPAVNPVGQSYTVPVGLLQLHAFDTSFEFSPALAALQDYVRINERRIEEQVRQAANAEASKGGRTVDELLIHLGGSPAIVMAFDFAPEPDNEGSEPSRE